MAPMEVRPFPTKRWRLAPLLQPVQAFLATESAGGIVLLACALAALAWANSPWGDSYEHFWHASVAIRARGHVYAISLAHCVNDGLMALFFLLVGLEIKRELLIGELASPRRAALPIAAALGGMIVPALIFTALNFRGIGSHGWGIPMATDIAFAVGVLTLVGRSVPISVKVFLLAIAIVDDLGAVIVIAAFYNTGLSMNALAVAGLLLVILIALNRLHVQSPLAYLSLGVGLWAATLMSGLHATIAGVLLAFTIPASRRTREGSETAQAPLARVEHVLLGPVTFGIVPLFALANAGVDLRTGAAAALGSPVMWGVFLGLLIGKPIGVLLASWIAIRCGVASMPQGATRRHVVGVGVLCGIGFTMSLFVANLAFPGHQELLAAAKVGILLASLIAGVVGGVILAWRVRRAE